MSRFGVQLPRKAQNFASILLSGSLGLSPYGFQSAIKGHYCSPPSCSVLREKKTNHIHLRNEEPKTKRFLLETVDESLRPGPRLALMDLISPVYCLIWEARDKVAAWLT